jgi:hypothetical protein
MLIDGLKTLGTGIPEGVGVGAIRTDLHNSIGFAVHANDHPAADMADSTKGLPLYD